jgi:hypothetical protein
MLARLAPLILLAMAMDFADFPRLQIAELLHRRNGLDAGALERAWKREEDAILGAPTPYGPVLQERKLPHRLHGEVTIQIAEPRALVWMEMRVSPAWAAFLQRSLPGGRSGLVFYMDDVRPGNVMRHDAGRLFFAFYWAMTDTPSWWRASLWGWYDLVFIRQTEVDSILGGMGLITDHMLQIMNFPIVIDHPEERIPRSIQLDFLFFLSDEKALKSMLGLKGSSSYHPCGCCANIVGRMDPDVVTPPMVHYNCPDAEQWDPWTYERFQAACALVRAAWGAGDDRGEEIGMQLGIAFEGGFNVNFTPRAPIVRVPESICWDAQHTIWASGGVGQYEVNQFLRAVSLGGVAFQHTENFVRQVMHPWRVRWTKPLADRVLLGEATHVKAFAGETIVLVASLTALCDMVLTPAAILEPHATSMRMLFTIQCLVLLGDSSIPHLQLLDELLEAHQAIFLLLYPACAKPKIHYMRHLARMYWKFKKAITCFSAERHHRMSKRVAAFCFYNMSHTLIARGLLKRLQFMQNTDFIAVRLGKSLRTHGRRSGRHARVLQGIGVQGLARSRSMRTEARWFSAGDFVLCRREAAAGDEVPWAACRAEEFWSTRGSTDHYMVAEQHDLAAAPDETGTSWLYRPTRSYIAIHHSRLFFSCSWVPDGDRIRIILPMYARRIFG